jgi:hypothetical protein
MNRQRLLAVLSGLQLATGVAGMAVAIRRRYAYDFLFLHGRSDRVARDALWMGTAYSAPTPMLVAQAIATVRVLRRPSPAAIVLGALGAAMVPGYLGEARVRTRLSAAGRDPFETPLVVVAFALAATMAAVAFTR